MKTLRRHPVQRPSNGFLCPTQNGFSAFGGLARAIGRWEGTRGGCRVPLGCTGLDPPLVGPAGGFGVPGGGHAWVAGAGGVSGERDGSQCLERGYSLAKSHVPRADYFPGRSVLGKRGLFLFANDLLLSQCGRLSPRAALPAGSRRVLRKVRVGTRCLRRVT